MTRLIYNLNKNGGRCPPFFKITYSDFVSSLGKIQVNLLIALIPDKIDRYAVNHPL